jgi:succinate dehydrogenase hydrophobic anchor subunit
MLIIIHVLFAMLNILKDYVYNESIFYFYKLLVILIIIKIGCYFIL